MEPLNTLLLFDSFLNARGLQFHAVIIGGTALNLLGVVTRVTRDCDVLSPAIALEISAAARQFAQESRISGSPLDDDWLNNGPSSLVSLLPNGWELRLQLVFTGNAMVLHCLGRLDLLRSKLFALCDRGIDLSDCLALAPTDDELRIILPWLERQDGNPDWPAHTKAILSDLALRLGYGF
jgi:hypothetical protein